MLLYENIDVPYVEKTVKAYQAELDKYFKVMKYWQRLSYLSLAIFISFALLTVVTMIATKFEWLFWVSLGCLVLSALFVVFSFHKWDSWDSLYKTWQRFMRPMEMTLVRAQEARCNFNSELYEGNEKQ